MTPETYWCVKWPLVCAGMTRGFEVAPEISSLLGVNTVLQQQQRNPSRVICLIEFIPLPIFVEAYREKCYLTTLSTLIPIRQPSKCSNSPCYQCNAVKYKPILSHRSVQPLDTFQRYCLVLLSWDEFPPPASSYLVQIYRLCPSTLPCLYPLRMLL